MYIWQYAILIQLFVFLRSSHCHGRIGVPSTAHVSVHNKAVLRRQQDIVWRMWQVHRRRIVVVFTEREHCLHLGTDGPLAPDGRDGNGAVRCVHSVRSITQSEGIHPATHRITHI